MQSATSLRRALETHCAAAGKADTWWRRFRGDSFQADPLSFYCHAQSTLGCRAWPSKIQRGGSPKEPASFAFQTARDDALAGTRNCDSNHFR